MESKNKNLESEHDQAPRQVRGAELRKQMEESEAKGKKFRAEHQGPDITPHAVSDDAEELIENDDPNERLN